MEAAVHMHALREESQREDDVTRLEPRVAAIEVDLRDLRKSMDQKLDKLDAKLDVRFERQDTKQTILLEKLDARFGSSYGSP
jgi:hypothetical protein